MSAAGNSSSAKWFERFILVQSASFLLQSVCQNPFFDVPQCSLSAPEGSVIELATATELRKHTFVRGKTRSESRKKLRNGFHWGSKRLSSNFQGFILFNTEEEGADGSYPKYFGPEQLEEWKSIFHERLPALLRTEPWASKFGTIFAKVAGKNRMGDKKRGLVKFSAMLKLARKRLKTATRQDTEYKTESARAAHEKRATDALAELQLIIRARNLVAHQYKQIVEVHQLSEFVLVHVKMFM